VAGSPPSPRTSPSALQDAADAGRGSLAQASTPRRSGAIHRRYISASNPEHDGSRRLVFLQVDQQLAEGPHLRTRPELADRVGSLEVGSIKTWSSSARAAGGRASRRALSPASISSRFMTWRLILRPDGGVVALGYASPSYNPLRASAISGFPL
jgi:hypothetical protein